MNAAQVNGTQADETLEDDVLDDDARVRLRKRKLRRWVLILGLWRKLAAKVVERDPSTVVHCLSLAGVFHLRISHSVQLQPPSA